MGLTAALWGSRFFILLFLFHNNVKWMRFQFFHWIPGFMFPLCPLTPNASTWSPFRFYKNVTILVLYKPLQDSWLTLCCFHEKAQPTWVKTRVNQLFCKANVSYLRDMFLFEFWLICYAATLKSLWPTALLQTTPQGSAVLGCKHHLQTWNV